MPWTNYHSHTHYCDGSDEPELYIKQAIKYRLPAYGYSSHAPINVKTDWCIADDKLQDYLSRVAAIKEKYHSDIQTYIGLEIDYIPGLAGRNKHILSDCKLDYFIGSIHFVNQFSDGTPWNIDSSKELFDKGLQEVFRGNYPKAAERFYEITWLMIEEDKPDVIGHLDKIKMYNKDNCYFNETEKWYRNLIDKTLDTVKQSGLIVEINTRGYYRYGQQELYPSGWIIEQMIAKDIPIMLNSDAHAPNEITAGFDYAANELRKTGLKVLWILLDNKWQAKSFSEDGLVL
jgi:histidinol-phosphatase (PHP family)